MIDYSSLHRSLTRANRLSLMLYFAIYTPLLLLSIYNVSLLSPSLPAGLNEAVQQQEILLQERLSPIYILFHSIVEITNVFIVGFLLWKEKLIGVIINVLIDVYFYGFDMIFDLYRITSPVIQFVDMGLVLLINASCVIVLVIKFVSSKMVQAST